jgi:small conductance mechanosensitive channel
VSDTIKIRSVTGLVEEINLVYTELITKDSEIITIPNKLIVDEIIHNSKANLVVEASICIAYDSGVSRAIAIIQDVLENNSRVVEEPPYK